MPIKTTKIITWILRLLAAGIMLQTLFFKFSASEESVYIFSTLGIEPIGRIGSGVAELIASILILIPATTWIGALLAVGIMSGAVLSHLMVLGLEVKGDGGLLFSYALIVFASSVALLIINRRKLFSYLPGKWFAASNHLRTAK